MSSTSTSDWSLLLANKVVFITGAAGHIAKCTAKTCYTQGARLVLGDLDPTLTNKVKDEIIGNENEDRILVVKLDVTDEASIQQAVQATIDKWKTIHVLLNTAACFHYGGVEEVSSEDWSDAFNVNVRGYALMVKYIAPVMKKQNSGSIVNIASTLGLVAIPNAVPYSVTKGAVIQLTRNLALDLGSFNIRVNSVSPTLVNVPSIDEHAQKMGITGEFLRNICISTSCLKQLCEVQDIANLMVFLASDLCRFMTGANLIVDGGDTII